MSLTPGVRVGAYEVIALIGAGGMGEVYRARDTRLQRDVALKVLPEIFAADPERLARFDREARTLASLNHPNIAQIYGLEAGGGSPALAMELVEGPTLADRIAQGPLSTDETLAVAKQLADALEAAHEHGIVHRDLKPANIKVRGDGVVKVLDFGLAKAVEGEGAAADVSHSPTLSVAATRMGVILGTAAYMSPEQARGKAVDKRTDIWAFGCVLYEMLTARRAFGGEDVADILGAVIHKEPDWAALPPVLSPALRAVLQRCLQKDQKQRMRDAGDIRLVLDGTFDAPARAPHVDTKVAAVAVRRSMVTSVAAGLVGASVAGLTIWTLMRPSPPSVVRLTAGHSGPEVIGGNSPDVAISPDGRRIAYVTTGGGQRRIHVRELDQLTSVQLTGGELGGAFISPDGQWVGFADGQTLKKIAITGGPAITICRLAGFLNGASWGSDDTIIFSYGTQGQGLWRVSAAGADPEPLTTADQQRGDRHGRPDILDREQVVLFDSVPASGVEDAQILAVNLQTWEQKIIIRGGTNPRYAASGHLVYAVAGAFRAVGFDPNRLEIVGNPVPIAENVKIETGGSASFALARNGTLVYIQDVVQSPQRTLVWVDREGREEPINTPPRGYVYPRISPDGTRVALDIRSSVQDGDIWVWDLARETLTRLTFGPGSNRTPVWAPDGRRLAFLSNRAGPTTNLFWQAADGTGSAERLTDSPEQHVPSSISPDGARLVFRTGAGGDLDLEMLLLGGERETAPLIETPFIEQNGEVSPDGRWIAYESNESGQFQIYVRPFPDVNRGRWQISTTGGTRPMWARNGRELFYLAPTGALMAVPVDSEASFAAGSPAQLLAGRYFEFLRTLDTSQIVGRTYDISPDGRRFLMIKDATPVGATAARPQIVVVQNWFEELRRLAPSN